MGRFERNGVEKAGTESELFYDCMKNEAGPVECHVCQVKFGQGNKGQALEVCKSCLEYVCTEHVYRHPNCEQGR
jgi:hypothetical protein